MSIEHSPTRAGLARERGAVADEEEVPHRTILRWPEVHRRRGKSRTQIWRDIRAGKFPAPVQLGPNSIGWYEDEVDEAQAKLPRVSYAPEPEAT